MGARERPRSRRGVACGVPQPREQRRLAPDTVGIGEHLAADVTRACSRRVPSIGPTMARMIRIGINTRLSGIVAASFMLRLPQHRLHSLAQNR
mgnify:CR=1 FL=1